MRQIDEPNRTTLNGFENGDLDEAMERSADALKSLSGASLFITGGTGFLGQWLLTLISWANAKCNLRAKITVLTRSRTDFLARCPELATDPAINLIEGDVRFFDFPKGRHTHVIHAATDTSLDADHRPLELMDTITAGTRRALEFALSSGVERMLLLSSGAVYGAQPAGLEAFPEDCTSACSTTDRRSAYGEAKRYAEQLATIYHTESGLKVIMARAFAFVGPGLPLDKHFAMGNFIRDAIAGKQIVVNGDGTPVRSYLYAADLAVWLLRLLVNGRPGAAYNVGSDQAISIRDLAELVSRTVPGAGGVIIKGEAKADGFRSRYVPSIDRARRELALDAWTPMDEAIRRTARWAVRQAKAPTVVADTSCDVRTKPKRNLVFVIDLDGVVASLTPNNDYALATPLRATIVQINRLYDAGHRIVLHTARGSQTGKDWQEITRRQLEAWGVKYHDVRFGKPAADYYVDDRLLSISELSRFADTVC